MVTGRTSNNSTADRTTGGNGGYIDRDQRPRAHQIARGCGRGRRDGSNSRRGRRGRDVRTGGKSWRLRRARHRQLRTGERDTRGISACPVSPANDVSLEAHVVQ